MDCLLSFVRFAPSEEGCGLRCRKKLYHITHVIRYPRQKWKKPGDDHLASLADFSLSVTRQTPEHFW